jgi:steroid delta-isomerase-like uncharacterized protein
MAQPEMRSIADVEKNWEKVRASLAPDCVYDEIATNRKASGINEVLSIWQGWAKAMPDSKATFDHQIVKDNTVVLELTWRGTHNGPLQTPRGDIAPTGRRFELKACQIIEMSGERAKTIRQYFDMNTLFQQLNVQLQP